MPGIRVARRRWDGHIFKEGARKRRGSLDFARDFCARLRRRNRLNFDYVVVGFADAKFRSEWSYGFSGFRSQALRTRSRFNPAGENSAIRGPRGDRNSILKIFAPIS